jgi:hypothetical protein
LADVWDELEERLHVDPGLQAKTLFEYLQEREPGRFQEGRDPRNSHLATDIADFLTTLGFPQGAHDLLFGVTLSRHLSSFGFRYGFPVCAFSKTGMEPSGPR